MKLPLIPGSDKKYTVVEYPSNAQVQKVARIMARDERVAEEEREQIAEQYNVEAGETISGPEADRKAAEVVFQEPIPSGVTGDDISPKAVSEATAVFFGIGRSVKSGHAST